MPAGIFAAPVTASGYVGLKTNVPKLLPAKDSVPWSRKTVSNGSRTDCTQAWNPINNKKFETLSYLPPQSDDSIAKEIDYMMKKFLALNLLRRGLYTGKIAESQGTTMGDIGHFGSCQCWGATTPPKSSMKLACAERHIQMLISTAWHLTISIRFNAWPLSFKNLQIPAEATTEQPAFIQFLFYPFLSSFLGCQ